MVRIVPIKAKKITPLSIKQSLYYGSPNVYGITTRPFPIALVKS